MSNEELCTCNMPPKFHADDCPLLRHQSKTIEALEAEVACLKGLEPEFPPYPPEGHGLPRYGLRWNGPDAPLAVPMADGYWTPFHLAERQIYANRRTDG